MNNFIENLNNSAVYQSAVAANLSEELTTSLDQLQRELPQYTKDVIQRLFNVSRGPEGGCMKTLGLVNAVQKNMLFEIDRRTVKHSKEMFAFDLETEACNPPVIAIPDHLEFKADWEKEILASGEGNNILGDNGGLYFMESQIRIPIVRPTNETLGYYGAVLIPENVGIRFPSDQAFPLWKMQVDSNYVKDYIMSKEGGGGFYLEFHHDQPHFHMVVNGGGYYLLAKSVSEGTFHITAFELSNGQAVYTKKGAIHCDAALTGDLVVGYNVSDNCSTVLLRNKIDKEIVNVEFVH